VIEVETNEKELLMREKSGKWKFSMDIQLSEDDWHQACFCVYLRGNFLVKSECNFLSEIRE
jgi:hypothetical protein